MATRSAPGIVAIPGRIAVRISVSGFALSSVLQKAISSATTPINVRPRMVRNEAVPTSIVMRFIKSMDSAVRRATSGRSIGTSSRKAST